MNAEGPIDTGGKVALSMVDALRNQPMTLAMVIFNVIFIAVVYFSLSDARKSQTELMKIMLDSNKQQAELLSRCVVPH